MSTEQEILEWLLREGRKISEQRVFVGRLCERLQRCIPGLYRAVLLHSTISQDIGISLWVWNAAGDPHAGVSADEHVRTKVHAGLGAVEEVLLDRAHLVSPMFMKSPFHRVQLERKTIRRRISDDACPHDFPIIDDLKLDGCTDYWVAPVLGNDEIVHGLSVSTRAPEGFTGEQIQLLEKVADFLALRLELFTLQVRTALDKKAIEMRVDFLTTVAHEFRTPLATITLSTDILLEHGPQMTDAQRHGRGEHISAALDRMRKLVDAVTDFTASRADENPLNPTTLDLAHVTRDWCQREIGVTGREAHVYVEGEANAVQCDLVLWRQTLSTLLDNARKFSTGDDPITLELNVSESHIHLRVTNVGDRVDKTDLQHLAAPFFRGKNASGKPGMGLGLTILQGKLHAVSGRLAFRALDEGGLCVEVTIPRLALESPFPESSPVTP